MSSYFTESDLLDSDSVSSMSPKFDPMGPNTSYPLRRGKACAVCRAHKIRCDGVRPICGSCQRKPKADRCEWDNSQSKSRVAILIETIKSLEARIFELEHPELVSPPVTLHYPYRRDEEEFLSHCSPLQDTRSRYHNSPFSTTGYSPDHYWDTTTSGSTSSTPSIDGESFTGGPVELEYAPAPPPHANASRYYQYRNDGGSYATSSLSAALMQSRSS